MSSTTSKVVAACFFLAASLAAGCAGRDEELVRKQVGVLKQALSSPSADISRDRDRAALWGAMRAFYEGRRYEPAWVDGVAPASAFDALLSALAEARDHGLEPERYDLKALTTARALAEKGFLRRDGFDNEQVVPLDIKATWAWIRYAADLSAGAADGEGPADKLWRLGRHKIDFPRLLTTSLENGTIEEDLRAFAPSDPEYARLKDAYARYLKIAEGGGWRALPAELTLKRGQRNSNVSALAERLAATGDLDRGVARVFQALESDVYDDRLSEAVARFQRRHGLEPDGVVGPSVVAGMNVPVERRVRQIELNLERWRWLPRDLGGRYVFVNVPAYRLEIHEGDRVRLAMSVIVGAKGTPTPIFSDTLTHIVFSPYWNVPDSIASGETLPAVQSDPAFLERNRMEVVGTSGRVVDPATIDWWSMSEGGSFPYRFRQRPGASNSLGLVKFVFPNEYDVYLHDTPADALFKRAYRALSHGCIRVERPIALAEYLLQDQHGWTSERIHAAMNAGAEQHVKLSRPIPVHLMYWTARAAEDRTVQFRQDVYGRDARELDALTAATAGPKSAGLRGLRGSDRQGDLQ